MESLTDLLLSQGSKVRWDAFLRAEPRLLDRYIGQRVLGIGATAIVIGAFDSVLGRSVAIKLFDPSSPFLEHRAIQVFQSEARRIAGLKHPNLCEIYDFGVISDRVNIPWIVMEWFQGSTLYQRILDAGRLPSENHFHFDTALNLAIQITAAIDLLHGEGLVQLDVKPGNMLVSDKGELKVIDLAAAYERAGDTASGNVRYGTPEYLAPEILDKTEEVGPQADVFSLGAVFCELCFIANPLQLLGMRTMLLDTLGIRRGRGEDRFAHSMAISFESEGFNNTPLSKNRANHYRKGVRRLDIAAKFGPLKGKVPQAFVDLVSRMLRVEPHKRPANAGIVLGRLREIRDHRFASSLAFISHSSKDKARFVNALVARLEAMGVNVWYDSKSLRVGESFWDRITLAMSQARFVLLIISENSLSSSAVAEELRMAKLDNLEKVKILPLLIDDLPLSRLPLDIRTRQVVRFPLPTSRSRFRNAVNALISQMQSLSQDEGSS